jgi:hypothetical protein
VGVGRLSAIALRLGPLGPRGLPVTRSGLRWLVPDGSRCRAGQMVAYCSLMFLDPRAAGFLEKGYHLQVALAPSRAGRIRHVPEPLGGDLDRLPAFPWLADTLWAELEPVDSAGDPASATELTFFAAQRYNFATEGRYGLLAGWNERVHAWWGEGELPTLLGLGTCEQPAVLRSEDGYFADLRARLKSAHIIVLADEPQVRCSRTLLEQLGRTAEQSEAIRADALRSFAAAGGAPTAADWILVGALLSSLEGMPTNEEYHLLTRSGLFRAGPPQAISMSLAAELSHCLRHRRLGYTINCHTFRFRRMGAAMKRWLQAEFEMIERSVEDVRRDLSELLGKLAGKSRVIMINSISTAAEDVSNYRLLDETTMRGLGSLRSKSLNLMLHDLSASHGLDIVDADSMAAHLGIRRHLPDRAHASGAMTDAIRREICRLLESPSLRPEASHERQPS